MEAIISLAILIIIFVSISKAAVSSGNPIGVIFQIIGAVFGAVGTGLYHLILRTHASRNGIHGTARFLNNWWEKPRLISTQHKGIVVDGKRKISLKRSFQHAAIVAPTGMGKTTKYVIPNLLQLKNGSAVVTDPSGDIFDRTAGYLQGQGYQTKLLDFSGLARSLRYNPLARAQSHSEIKQVATVLVESAFPDAKGDAAFWNIGGINIIYTMIKLLKSEAPEVQNLYNLRFLLNSFGQDGAVLNDFVARNADQSTFREYQSFLAQDLKVIQGALSTAKNALDKISDPVIAEMTANESLDFESLRTEKTVLYVVVPEHAIAYNSYLLKLLFSQMMENFMRLPAPGQMQLPIFMFLDEVGNMGKLPNFATMMTTLRRYEVSVSLVLQSVQQLFNTYGDADANTILDGGTATKIFFAGLGLKTTEELERVLGKRTLWYMEPGMNRSEREVARSLLTSDEIRRMPTDQALFIHANIRPARLKMLPYYKSQELNRRSQIKPQVPTYPVGQNLPLVQL